MLDDDTEAVEHPNLVHLAVRMRPLMQPLVTTKDRTHTGTPAQR